MEGMQSSAGFTFFHGAQPGDQLGYQLIDIFTNCKWPLGGIQIRFHSAVVQRSEW